MMCYYLNIHFQGQSVIVTGLISTRYRNTRMFADTQISCCNQTKCQRCVHPHTLCWQRTVKNDCVGGGSIKFVVSLELFLPSCFHDILMYRTCTLSATCKCVFCSCFGVKLYVRLIESNVNTIIVYLSNLFTCTTFSRRMNCKQSAM